MSILNFPAGVKCVDTLALSKRSFSQILYYNLAAICVRNESLAKDAVNSVTEVFVEVCNSLSRPVGNAWRVDYGTGEGDSAIVDQITTVQLQERDVEVVNKISSRIQDGDADQDIVSLLLNHIKYEKYL